MLPVILQGECLPRELAGCRKGGGAAPRVQDGIGGPDELQRGEVGPELPDPCLETHSHRATTRPDPPIEICKRHVPELRWRGLCTMFRNARRGSASPAHLHATVRRVRVRVSGEFRAAAGGERAYPMRKVEAPLSMTMGVESGKRAKSVSRGGR